MKKLICSALILLILLSSLTACNFTQTVSGILTDSAESTPKVEEMMLALAENRQSDAIALMHPQVADNSEAAIAQMSDYLDGRKVSSLEANSVNINNSVGTSGKSKEEQVIYRVTLTDNTVIFLNVVHLSDNGREGFTSFQLVLGAI